MGKRFAKGFLGIRCGEPNYIGKSLDQSGESRLDGGVPIRTAKYLLVQERLGIDLAELLAERREAGATYERIARELWSTTDVDITSQTVANWCADLSPTDAAGAA